MAAARRHWDAADPSDDGTALIRHAERRGVLIGVGYARRLEAKLRDAIGAHPALRHVALAMAWLLLWRVYELMQYAPHASIWFPPAGLTFVALLIMGWHAVPVLVARNRRLTELGCSDDLTKTVSKGHFFECAERELASARERSFAVSLIVLDIDHFKAINDHHGHAVGDQALIRLALVARTQWRQPQRPERHRWVS